MSTTLIDIGVNGAFLTRRWEEPENWMRLTREAGFTYHEFCGDVLDPFFSGDWEYQQRTARAVRAAAEKYGVTIVDIYTGMATHRFHGLSHSDPAVRNRMREWITRTMDLAVEVGTDRIGGHWDAIPVEVLSDERRLRSSLDRLYETFRELATVAKEKGLEAICDEQMYIPSEVPWTLDGAEEFLVEVNRDRAGVPVYLTVDVGHVAGTHYGLDGDDTDYVKWLERFACVSEIIHLQQTMPDSSAHWPFTEEFNERGHVDIEKVLAAVERSLKSFSSKPFADFVPLPERIILSLEIIPGSTTTEETVLEWLRRSCTYLREFVPEGGIAITID